MKKEQKPTEFELQLRNVIYCFFIKQEKRVMAKKRGYRN